MFKPLNGLVHAFQYVNNLTGESLRHRHNHRSFLLLIDFNMKGIDCFEVKLQWYVMRRWPVLRQCCDVSWECHHSRWRNRCIALTQTAGCDSADDHLFNGETDDGRVVLESHQGQISFGEEDTFLSISMEEYDDALSCYSTCIAATTTLEIEVAAVADPET